MPDLGEAGFLNKRLAKDNENPREMEGIAERLAELHKENISQDRLGGNARPEKFRVLLEDLMYQMKRYFLPAVYQPILDMIRHPADRFLDDQSKMFNKRIRKKRAVDGHGMLIPEHIFIKERLVFFVSPQAVHQKYAKLDAANDVASVSVELLLNDMKEHHSAFIESYIRASKDKDLPGILPLYQTFRAMKRGINLCELKVALNKQELSDTAMEYFHLAVKFSREIPRR